MFRSYAALDRQTRLKKAEKVIKSISKYKNIGKCRILDIGTGSGYLDSVLYKKAKSLVGIDYVDERKTKGFAFFRSTAVKLPFKNNSFDVIICNHVIEHVKEQDEVLSEINRVLKKDGICYMTCPNKIWPMEPHLKLPFLSMMPRKIAGIYVRFAGKGECYDIYPMTYAKFSRKLKKLFRIENFTFEVLKNPSSYGFEGKLYSLFSISRHMPAIMLDFANYFLPNWILILRKK